MTKTRDAHESEMKTQACFTRCCLLLHMVPKMSVKEAPASCAVTASQAAWGESVWGMRMACRSRLAIHQAIRGKVVVFKSSSLFSPCDRERSGIN